MVYHKNKIVGFCLAILVVVIGLILYDIFFLGPGQGLYRYNMDIDLNSGILRKRFYYWIIPVKDEVVPTNFSRMVNIYLPNSKKPKWKESTQTVTISGAKIKKGGRAISSCRVFIDTLVVAESSGNLSEDKKRIYLQTALDLLKVYKIQELEKLSKEIDEKYIK